MRRVLIFTTLLLGWVGQAWAVCGTAPYVVTSTADDGSDGTLRWAITCANLGGGTESITFNIAGAGVHTITLGSALPAITATAITVDGTTQGGTSCTTPTFNIVVDANGILNSGFYFQGANGLIKGIEVHGVSGSDTSAYGIKATTTSTIQCCASHDNWGGIVVQGNGNTIGGTNVGQRNFTYSNTLAGITLFGDGNVAYANYTGVLADGLTAAANDSGIYVESGDANIIGDGTAAGRNIASGNLSNGVGIKAGVTNTVVQGNYIGANKNAALVLCNGGGDVSDAGTGTTLTDNLECPFGCCQGNAALVCFLGSSCADIQEANCVGVNGVTVCCGGDLAGQPGCTGNPDCTGGGTCDTIATTWSQTAACAAGTCVPNTATPTPTPTPTSTGPSPTPHLPVDCESGANGCSLLDGNSDSPANPCSYCIAQNGASPCANLVTCSKSDLCESGPCPISTDCAAVIADHCASICNCVSPTPTPVDSSASHVTALELTQLKGPIDKPTDWEQCVNAAYDPSPRDFCRCTLFTLRKSGVSHLMLRCPEDLYSVGP